MRNSKLKVVPFYTDRDTLDLSDKRIRFLLWLEILFNDGIEWEKIDNPIVKISYEKACIWYWSFKSLFGSYIKRKPLEFKEGKPDLREYRRFLEALNFVRA
ncbi:MAG: hypothetical protein AB1630_02965 [bacterium]